MKPTKHKVEVFYDVSSPWTYLAFARLLNLEAEFGYEFDWKPILVGGVFNAVNDTVYESRAKPHPIKSRYYIKDLQDWARFVGVRIGQPPVFPVRSVAAMRAAIYAKGQGRVREFSLALFESYWGDLKDISQWEEIRACATLAGLDPDEVQRAAESPEMKSALAANTQALIDRGGFGSPTIYIDENDMYFGNDRMELIEARLASAESDA